MNIDITLVTFAYGKLRGLFFKSLKITSRPHPINSKLQRGLFFKFFTSMLFRLGRFYLPNFFYYGGFIMTVIFLKKKEDRHKFFTIQSEWEKFYEAREKALNTVDIPVSIQVKNRMKEIVENNELETYYQNFKRYRKDF